MDYTIPAGAKIGHVHLKVSDLDRAEAFYRDVLGFEVQQHYDSSAAFLSAGGYHHHIGLNIWQSRGGPPPAPGTTGLFHLAILYPTRADLATAVKRVLEHGVPLTGASRPRRLGGHLPARSRWMLYKVESDGSHRWWPGNHGIGRPVRM
jgi:catechol 2,3-dioxygenase